MQLDPGVPARQVQDQKGAMRRLLIAFLIILSVTAAGSCDRTGTDRGKGQAADDPAAPVLTLGLIPEQNIFTQKDRYAPVADYLSRKTGFDVRLKLLLRYGNIIDNFVSEGLDGAFFGSFTYALAHKRLGVKAVARPESAQGRSTYFGMIIVRKDSGISKAGDMRGKRFVFVDKATTAGYLLPLAYFRTNGIDPSTDLQETYFAGTHETAIYDVLDGRADVGAAKNTVFERLAAENARVPRELKVLARSPDVPENALALRKDIDPSVADKVREALVTMHETAEGAGILKAFGARRFIGTTDADYRPVYEYAREAGIDLSAYDYRNN
jgi:phosphonate transport system substrate-binding protein